MHSDVILGIMFAVSARGMYGLSALVELGFGYGKGAVQIRDIAREQEIPQNYLEQILATLRKANIVESYRGVNGGYALARHPSQINVLDVLSNLEGRLEVIPDQRKGNSLAFFWKQIEGGIRKSLDRSLEELLSEIQHRNKKIMYSI